MANDPSLAATDGTCYFDRLPREMRDKIYEAAYTCDRWVKINFKNGHSVVAIASESTAPPPPLNFADDLVRFSDRLGALFTENVQVLRVDHEYLPSPQVLEEILSEAQPDDLDCTILPFKFTRVAPPLEQFTQLRTLVITLCKYDYQWNWNTSRIDPSEPKLFRADLEQCGECRQS